MKKSDGREKGFEREKQIISKEFRVSKLEYIVFEKVFKKILEFKS